MPVATIVLTLLGDLGYLGWAIGFFIGLAETGWVLLQFTVLFVTTLGVLCCVVMMGVRPKLHIAWGVSVLLFSLVALAIDGYILVNFFTSSVPAGIFWSVPLVLVMIGGILAIIWKPPMATERLKNPSPSG